MSEEMRFHRFSEVFPLMPMEGEEWEANVASVKKHGLRVPILLHKDGSILDGRNRYRWCQAAGIPVNTETFDGTDEEALDEIFILNYHHRHLTPTQRAMAAQKYADMKRGDAAKQQERTAGGKFAPYPSLAKNGSRSAVAKKFGTTVAAIDRAKAVEKYGDEETKEAVRSGRMKLTPAYNKVIGKPRDYKEEYREKKENKALLKLVEDLPSGQLPPERKPAKPVPILSFLQRITRVIGNMLRNDKYLSSVVANREYIPADIREQYALTLRHFAEELQNYADQLEETNDREVLDGSTC